GGLIGTPDTRHYLTHDIYTLITAAMSDSFAKTHADQENAEGADGFDQFEEPATYAINIGDTVRYRNGIIVIKGINRDAQIQNLNKGKDDLLVGLQGEVISADGKQYEAEPLLVIKGGNSFDFGKDVEEQGLRLRFSNIMPTQDKLDLMGYYTPIPEKKWIVFKAIKFPYINLFWAGTIVMTIGFLLSIFRRNRDLKRDSQRSSASTASV